jgi:hypothetical protein
VNILTPKNQSSFTEANVQLSARVENVTNSNQVKVRHNKLNITAFTLDKGGNLSASIKLVEGSNTLTVEASTADGAHQDVVTVTYKPVAAPPPPPPALKPLVSITVPKRSGITVSNPAYTVKAMVKNIEDAAQIKVIFNGQTITVFQFSPLTGNLSIPLTLKEGKNNLQVDASTRTGNASARTEINYVKVNQEPAPEVEIESASQPAVSPFNPNEASSQILAKTKYVTDKGQIGIKVNDVALTNFDFDAATGKMNFIIRLKKGVNEVEVRVKTDQGEDTDSINVRFD